jgi:hypothetical protein
LAAGKIVELAELGHVFDGDFDGEVEYLASSGVDDGYGTEASCGRGWLFGGFVQPLRRFFPHLRGEMWGARVCSGAGADCAAEEAGDLFQWALCGAETDALDWVIAEGFEAFQGEGEVSASLGWDECVDLVDDDGVDGAEGFACVGGEEKVERFGGGDENFAGMTFEAGSIFGAGVAGADADFGDVDGDALALGEVGDAGEGHAEVALDVDGESLEGRDIQDAAAGSCGGLAEHELV